MASDSLKTETAQMANVQPAGLSLVSMKMLLTKTADLQPEPVQTGGVQLEVSAVRPMPIPAAVINRDSIRGELTPATEVHPPIRFAAPERCQMTTSGFSVPQLLH